MVAETATSMLSDTLPRRYKAGSTHVADATDMEQDENHRPNINILYEQHGQLSKVISSSVTCTTAQPTHEPTSSRRAYDVMDNVILEWLFPWKRIVNNAGNKQDIIALIRHFGLNSIANRLAYLDRLAEDDPEEEFIGLESLRRFAIFALGRHLPDPKIGISPGGLVHAAWWASDGILSMDFLPSGKIRFVAVLQDGQWSDRGVLPPGRMLAKIEPFMSALHHGG